MSILEDKLRPAYLVRAWPRDALEFLLLLAMAAVLVPAWNVGADRYVSDIAGQMTSFYLLPALGMLLALRVGAIDLSVWVVSAAGGATAAALINAGVADLWAFAAAGAVGLAAGGINAGLVTGLNLPSVLVTGGLSLATAGVTWAVTDTRAIEVTAPGFREWGIWPSVPPGMSRMLAVAGLYSLVLVVLVSRDAGSRRRASMTPRKRMVAALLASGALSGLAGACWLIDRASTPMPVRPIGDLRIPAAAILAGGALLGGRGRTMLAGIFLLAALLLTTIWRQEVCIFQAWGFQLQLALLIGMCAGVHAAFAEATTPAAHRPRAAAAAAFMTAAGMVSLAAAAGVETPSGRTAWHIIGLGLWTVGVILLLVARRAPARPRPTDA